MSRNVFSINPELSNDFNCVNYDVFPPPFLKEVHFITIWIQVWFLNDENLCPLQQILTLAMPEQVVLDAN